MTCVGLATPPETTCGEHTPFSRGDRRDASSLTTTPLPTPGVSMGDDVCDTNPVAVVVGMTTGMCELGPICTTCGEVKWEVGTMCLVGVIMKPVAAVPGGILVAGIALPPISTAILFVGGAEFS